jgi:hypothetical protein
MRCLSKGSVTTVTVAICHQGCFLVTAEAKRGQRSARRRGTLPRRCWPGQVTRAPFCAGEVLRAFFGIVNMRGDSGDSWDFAASLLTDLLSPGLVTGGDSW